MPWIHESGRSACICGDRADESKQTGVNMGDPETEERMLEWCEPVICIQMEYGSHFALARHGDQTLLVAIIDHY